MIEINLTVEFTKNVKLKVSNYKPKALKYPELEY